MNLRFCWAKSKLYVVFFKEQALGVGQQGKRKVLLGKERTLCTVGQKVSPRCRLAKTDFKVLLSKE